MPFAGNAVWYGPKGTTITAPRPISGAVHEAVVSNTYRTIELQPTTDASIITALQEQGGVRVDFEGTQEAVTGGVVQTATTLKGLWLNNDAGDVVINIRNQNATGTLLAGPFTIEASKGRIMVFPTALSAPQGVFIHLVSGTFAAAQGFLVP